MRLVAVLSLVVTLVYGLPAEKLRSTGDYDHFVFAQEYPAGMCFIYNAEGKGYDCFYPSNCSSWTIHGLWPTEGTTKGPNFCTNDPFDSEAIQSILPELLINWPNMLNTTGFYSFWSHEYTKHGTCSGMKELDFFTTVLNIFKDMIPFGKALANGDIYPDNETGYEADKIKFVLKKSLGVTPDLQCKKTKHGMVLQQIELCLDLDHSPMDCPDPDRSDSCGSGTVLYPKSVYSN